MKRKETRAAVLSALKRWRGTFDLDGWYLKIIFTKLDDGVLASCSGHWQYRQAHLTFDLGQLRRRGMDEIEECVIHELLHVCLLGYQTYRKHPLLEEAVSRLTTSYMRCVDEPWRERPHP